MSLDKYSHLIDRLVTKIERSQTPVPGFIVGLSGSDSILAFLIIYEACQRKNLEHRVMGVHYVNPNRRKMSWFEEHIFPWLTTKCPKARLLVETPLGGNQDQQRWADLHLRALNHITKDGDPKCGDEYITITPRDPGENYWVAGSINATEKLLGKYSMLANCVSIQPIQTVYKSQVLSMCDLLGVPEIAIRNARIPDCLCGRDELAANNIELIDQLLTFDPDVMNHDPTLVAKLQGWIRDLKHQNDFRMRIPYIL